MWLKETSSHLLGAPIDCPGALIGLLIQSAPEYTNAWQNHVFLYRDINEIVFKGISIQAFKTQLKTVLCKFLDSERLLIS